MLQVIVDIQSWSDKVTVEMSHSRAHAAENNNKQNVSHVPIDFWLSTSVQVGSIEYEQRCSHISRISCQLGSWACVCLLFLNACAKRGPNKTISVFFIVEIVNVRS